jgi:hypothetical protein
MTEEELRRVLQDIVTDKDRRAARTREITNPIVKDQALMQSEIRVQKENTDDLKLAMKEGFSEIKALLKK